MKKSREEAAARILRPLSDLFQTELVLDETARGIVARARALSDVERRLTDEVFDLVCLVEDNETRLQALEEQVSKLRYENFDLHAKNHQLSEISARDALTGLYNRWYVMEKIDAEMNRALRHGLPMSVLMLDIDHFKRINDSFGHPAGDSVLKSVGAVLKESCRVYDVPGRYGGEEFCIVFPDTASKGTSIVAERIREKLEHTPHNVASETITVTASIGVAGTDSVTDEGVLSANALLERADRALYTAKNHGRNRVELWRPASAETSH